MNKQEYKERCQFLTITNDKLVALIIYKLYNQEDFISIFCDGGKTREDSEESWSLCKLFEQELLSNFNETLQK